MRRQVPTPSPGVILAYIGSPSNPGGEVQAQLLQPAARGTGSGMIKQRPSLYAIYALLGAIFGAVIGTIISAGRQPQRPTAQGA